MPAHTRGRPVAPHRRRALLAVVAGAAAVALVAGCSNEPERSEAAYCAQVSAVQGLSFALEAGDGDALAGYVDGLRGLQAVAPAEVEPAVGALVAVTEDVEHTLGTTPDPQAAVTEVLTRRRDDLEAIRAAGEQIEVYTATTCGVVLNTSGSVAGTVPGTAPGSTAVTTPTPGPSAGP